MLRYLIKTLLQMNLFTDTMRNPSNGTDLFFNGSLPSFNGSLLDWGNFTGFNGKHRAGICPLHAFLRCLTPLWFVFARGHTGSLEQHLHSGVFVMVMWS